MPDISGTFRSTRETGSLAFSPLLSRGTEGSNPAPSSGESAKYQSLSGGLLALVRSLCAYDLVGFQTQQDLDGFRDYLMGWARLGAVFPGPQPAPLRFS